MYFIKTFRWYRFQDGMRVDWTIAPSIAIVEELKKGLKEEEAYENDKRAYNGAYETNMEFFTLEEMGTMRMSELGDMTASTYAILQNELLVKGNL